MGWRHRQTIKETAVEFSRTVAGKSQGYIDISPGVDGWVCVLVWVESTGDNVGIWSAPATGSGGNWWTRVYNPNSSSTTYSGTLHAIWQVAS